VSAGAASQTTVVLAVRFDHVSERFADAFASIRAQARQTPIVVVDNASTSPIPPLPGAWVVRAPSRLSAGAARNLGLSRVTTPYVVVWDAYDIMLPGTLSILEGTIAANPGLVAFAMAILEDPSRARHRWPPRWIARLISRPHVFGLLNAIWPLYPTTGATIIRTELVRAVGGYGDADSGEDWALGLSLAFRGAVGWSERPGRLHRIPQESPDITTQAELRRHASTIRERIRSDGGIPDWVRISLPAIWLAQWVTIGTRVVLEALRQRIGTHVGLEALRQRRQDHTTR
jgi:hypothetical protein